MEPKQIIEKLNAIGVCYEYESSPHLDEDGCFELALMSNESDDGQCGDSSCCTKGEGTPDDYNEIASAVGELGCEIVDFGSASWEGYSCYTPDPGGIRRIKVRKITLNLTQDIR